MRTHVTFFGIYPLFEKAAMQMPPFLSEIVVPYWLGSRGRQRLTAL